MKAPINWLKEYVDIKLPLKELMWKMTEAGLTCESYEKRGSEFVLDIEITANRPDWMSITGIAREIAAVQATTLKLPKVNDIPKLTTNLPINIINDFSLCPRYSAITISNVTQKDSPKWIQDRLKSIGLRPINNLVDITNYVMFELGNPIHMFDYDKLKDGQLNLKLSKGGEQFISVDKKKYKLPEDAMIFTSRDKVVDLCGIKGGYNSGITPETKNILIHAPVYNGVIIRKTSQKLSLASDASKIFERGANLGGTLDTLKRVVNLTQEHAGGDIASKIYDVKKEKFDPWKLTLSFSKLENILGIKIPDKEVVNILSRLTLSPVAKNGGVSCTIPTFRADLTIEEDLIEEIARIYGYNNFPHTLPGGNVAITKTPYFYDRIKELDFKNFMYACGYYETNTLALIPKGLIANSRLRQEDHIKIDNPASLEYEYMRTSLIPSLMNAVKLNALEKELKLFEYNKTYHGPIDKSQEKYKLAFTAKPSNYNEVKGVVAELLMRLRINGYEIVPPKDDRGFWDTAKSGIILKDGTKLGTLGEIHPEVMQNFGIGEPVFAAELDINSLASFEQAIKFTLPPKYPPQIEDMTLEIKQRIYIGEVISAIKSSSRYIEKVELRDIYENNYTFRIWYQHPEKTLTDNEIKVIRDKITLTTKKLGVSIK